MPDRFLKATTETGQVITLNGNHVIDWGTEGKLSLAEGNQAGLRHGANSDAIVSTRAADVCDALVGVYPWVLDSDRVGIEQYCRAEARTRLLTDWMMDVVTNKGGVGAVPAHIWSEISKAETNAMRAATSLGLNPEGRMKIAKDAGFVNHFNSEKLANLVAQGREMRAGGR